MARTILVSTANEIAGRRTVQTLGLVRGIVVRAPGIGQGLRGGFAAMFGGNITAYEEVCEAARAHAYDRMVQHAVVMGADGVIAFRYDATEFQQGITEVIAYGTAVKLGAEST
jgi:uncharacterized protein YbjQ (UPF0145 family)